MGVRVNSQEFAPTCELFPLIVIPACLLVVAESRRVQIRPRIAEPQVYYEEDEGSQAAEDDYATAVYQPRTRALPSPRSKDTLQSAKPPPVQTIRNYNKVNDDGSFTFGYEAADGSFKEETRGTDCVVRGKYGYVDPDGNKREFTYVSGNPCDPNAPKDDDDDDLPQKQEDDDEVAGPANYPAVRPVPRPSRPNYPTTTARAPTTIFQTQYQLDDDASQELEDAKPQLRPTPSAFRRPQQPSYLQVSAAPSSALYQPASTPNPSHYRLSSAATSQYESPTTPSTLRHAQPTLSSTVYRPVETSTPRVVQRARPQSVAITPRPHVAQVAAQYVSPSSTERPGVVFVPRVTTSPSVHRTTAASTPQLDFAAELERYVNTVAVSPRPGATPGVPRVKAAPASDPIYQSELVLDPATAQQQSLLGLQQLQHHQRTQQPLQSSLYRQPAPAQSSPASSVAPQPQQTIFRQQQAELLQQSQQLYAQQQRRQQQQHQQQPQQQQPQQQQQQPQQQQPHRFQLLDPQRDAQSFYYVQAPQSTSGSNSPLSAAQIDQFLRGAAGSF
ncbi:putative mediator of RNA polymerase II transcription subunit 12 [Orussus abietinus]|uniref:putative mediator of RNA polymerase II transcription subunit 12 n=1 Tax=Orussus abietinus TaxID=222816 RepID=UPI0006264AFF|nr:putative mediator of RNA polymerase II transcription subunit 12 [Orussus abietinus]